MINVKLAYRLLLSSHSIYCAARRVTAAAAGGERGRSPANGFRRGESPVAVAVAEDASFGRGLFLSMGRLSACSGESTFTHISESIMETWQSYLAFFKWASALLCAAYKHDHENCCENFAGMRDKGGASISFYPSHSLSRFGTISCWANMSDCDNVMSICYGNQLGILAPPHPSSPACRKSVIVQRWTNQERKLFFFRLAHSTSTASPIDNHRNMNTTTLRMSTNYLHISGSGEVTTCPDFWGWAGRSVATGHLPRLPTKVS